MAFRQNVRQAGRPTNPKLYSRHCAANSDAPNRSATTPIRVAHGSRTGLRRQELCAEDIGFALEVAVGVLGDVQLKVRVTIKGVSILPKSPRACTPLRPGPTSLAASDGVERRIGADGTSRLTVVRVRTVVHEQTRAADIRAKLDASDAEHGLPRKSRCPTGVGHRTVTSWVGTRRRRWPASTLLSLSPLGFRAPRPLTVIMAMGPGRGQGATLNTTTMGPSPSKDAATRAWAEGRVSVRPARRRGPRGLPGR